MVHQQSQSAAQEHEKLILPNLRKDVSPNDPEAFNTILDTTTTLIEYIEKDLNFSDLKRDLTTKETKRVETMKSGLQDFKERFSKDISSQRERDLNEDAVKIKLWNSFKNVSFLVIDKIHNPAQSDSFQYKQKFEDEFKKVLQVEAAISRQLDEQKKIIKQTIANKVFDPICY